MNATVASLTRRSLLGRTRTLVLLLLPMALLALCALAQILAALDDDFARELDGALAPDLLEAFGIAILMPLLGLVTGTGSIGPEIDEGSIVYLLAKPVNRYSIVVTKLVVAIAVVVVFGVVPVAVAGAVLTGEVGAVAGAVLTGEVGAVAGAFAVGALAAGVAYCALFLMLAVVTRNAVVIGLIYALIWETLVGGLVPGAQALSVQQWSLAVVEQVLGDSAVRLGVESAVGFGTGLVLLVLTALAATAYAGWQLQRLRLNAET